MDRSGEGRSGESPFCAAIDLARAGFMEAIKWRHNYEVLDVFEDGRQQLSPGLAEGSEGECAALI